MSKVLKRAQISLLVIISTIIVVGAIVIISINSDSIAIFSDDKSSYKVKLYVENCLEVETKEAIRKIGLHGGWLYHDEMIFSDKSMPDLFNKKAKGLTQFGVTIPYWYYYDDANEVFETNIPPYDTPDEYSLKNQVRKYLEDGLEKNCINRFKPFENIYNIKYEPKDIVGNVEVIFDGDEITSELNLPLEIIEISTNNVEFIDSFKIEADNKLWVPYYLARDIVAAEMNLSFIEKRVMDVLVPYQSKKGRDMLPPTYDFAFEFDFEPWEVGKVKKLSKQIVEANIGLVQFINTDAKTYPLSDGIKDSAFANGFVNTYTKDYLSESSLIIAEDKKLFRKFRDYYVTPIYQSSYFPMDFKLGSSMGNAILFPKPEMFLNFIPFFFTQYKTSYELSLPIMFEIRSNNQNDNFIFNLVIEANIANNAPLSENLNFNMDELDELKDKLDVQKTLICDPSQMISDYVYLNITDPVQYGEREYNGPLKGVEDGFVTFDCKGLAKCFITKTENNGEYISNNITQLKFRLPINCDPGTLEISKFKHKKLKIENLDPQINGEIKLGSLELPSEKKVDLKIKIVESGLSRFSKGRSPTADEKGFVIFTNLEDEDLVKVVQFSKDDIDDMIVELTIGNYKIEGFLISEKPFNIPEEEICYDKGFFSSEECETIPQLNFTTWLTGGIEIDSFTVELDDLLMPNNELSISLIDYGIPETYADLEKVTETMQNLKETSYIPTWFD